MTPDFDTDPRRPSFYNLGKFALGRCVATPGALAYMREHDIYPQDLLERHQAGEWGQIDVDDIQANEDALENGGRLLSAYGQGDNRLWILTEADRSATTILLPSEY